MTDYLLKKNTFFISFFTKEVDFGTLGTYTVRMFQDKKLNFC